MQQEHNAATLKLSKLSELEQENEELKKSLTEKEVQLRYAEDLLLRQLIEHPVRNSIPHRLLIFPHNISSRQKQATRKSVRRH